MQVIVYDYIISNWPEDGNKCEQGYEIFKDHTYALTRFEYLKKKYRNVRMFIVESEIK